MKLEDFFNAVVGSREGEFKPSLEEVMPEEELMAAFDKTEKEKRSWRDRTTPPSLQEGKKKSSKNLGGGVNKSLFVEFTNGERGVFKPLSGEDENVRDQIETGTLYKRERAAYLVDRFFDFNIVPPTVIKKIDDDIGSVQNFIPDTLPYYEVSGVMIGKKRDIFYDKLKILWIFDILIHNSDRHQGNVLCSAVEKKILIHAIDNGCSFSKDAYSFRCGEFFNQKLPHALITKIKKFIENPFRQGILKGLLLELLSENEVNAFFARVEKIGRMLIEKGGITEEEKETAISF
jgi:hypothetical protein